MLLIQYCTIRWLLSRVQGKCKTVVQNFLIMRKRVQCDQYYMDTIQIFAIPETKNLKIISIRPSFHYFSQYPIIRKKRRFLPQNTTILVMADQNFEKICHFALKNYQSNIEVSSAYFLSNLESTSQNIWVMAVQNFEKKLALKNYQFNIVVHISVQI